MPQIDIIRPFITGVGVLYSPPHNYPYQAHIGDRTCGILMQLISCLQCRRCPHYFLPAVDLFRGTFLSPFHVESYHALHTKSFTPVPS